MQEYHPTDPVHTNFQISSIYPNIPNNLSCQYTSCYNSDVDITLYSEQPAYNHTGYENIHCSYNSDVDITLYSEHPAYNHTGYENIHCSYNSDVDITLYSEHPAYNHTGYENLPLYSEHPAYNHTGYENLHCSYNSHVDTPLYSEHPAYNHTGYENIHCSYNSDVDITLYSEHPAYNHTGYDNPNAVYSKQFIADPNNYADVYNDNCPQNQWVKNQPFYQENYPMEQVSLYSYYDECDIQTEESSMPDYTSIIQNNTVHNQYCTELEVNSTEQASNRNDVRKFKISEVKNNYEECIHNYTFIWTEYLEGVRYLCVDIAEYDLLRGQELNMFNQMMEESLSLEIGDKECTLNHQRLNYQKRKSKRNKGDGWYSCTKDYRALKKWLKESDWDKDQIAEIVKLHSLFQL